MLANHSYEKITKIVVRGLLDLDNDSVCADDDGVVVDLTSLLENFDGKHVEITVSAIETGGVPSE